MINIFQIVFGLILALFLPGYLLARVFFKELSELEKIALAFVLSISIDIFLGLFLGYNEKMKNITGGITAFNLWLYLGSITVILLVLYIWRQYEEVKKVITFFKGKFKKKEEKSEESLKSELPLEEKKEEQILPEEKQEEIKKEIV